jgi:hypothetical protein
MIDFEDKVNIVAKLVGKGKSKRGFKTYEANTTPTS